MTVSLNVCDESFEPSICGDRSQSYVANSELKP